MSTDTDRDRETDEWVTATPGTPEEPKRAEAFVEYLSAAVGYNLRHYADIAHRSGGGCPCRPSHIPHIVPTGSGSARPATLTPEQPVKAPGQGGDLLLTRGVPVEVTRPSGDCVLCYVDEGGYQFVAGCVGNGTPYSWEGCRIVRVLTEDKPSEGASALPDLPRPIAPEDVRVGMLVERRKGEVAYRDRVQRVSGNYIGSDPTRPYVWMPENANSGWSLWLVEDAPAPVDPDTADRQCAWADYRKDYGVGESDMVAAHKAFMAGWKAAREGDQSGPLR